ncbi:MULTISPECIES: peptidoglycan-associated lipoprotein Pal [Larsenimonas]|uniref:Peptidoglycan-associated protein n=1 Tax=Larsenimonas suaedae TaxID=1851019 RepID=A0ABU1GX04_9GAMM|nr:MULTISPECIES: peptidoglycan-associated lipoprotein Pal [Larsenimonas]MCM2971361.1 peptidoglycan-associated lipoprotein Pal [Larsenimonas suaedae]MCM5703468.1 peptidoglycan-associated lipoprotein Pal [Larsenimonas salina]MDR5896072.1 peptidoglycan-associated lipoprotein Pal [Larsenimonas suaedae]
MQFTTTAKTLAAALSFAVIAGCSSGGGTQDGTGSGTMDTDGMTSGTSSQGMNSGQNMNVQMPDVMTIYFEFDQETIQSKYEQVLNGHAAYLKANQSASVVLQGYADERGTREYNLALGERRANAVKQYLVMQGVSASQIEVVSYGEERPAVEGHSESAYAENRRVVFDY